MATGKTFGATLARIEQHFAAADLAAVERELKPLAAKHGADPRLQVVQARLQVARGDASAGEAALRAIVEQHPDQALARGYLGAVLAGQRQYAAALPLLESALAGGADAPALRHALGVALGASGRHADALPHLAAAAEAMPSAAPTFFYLGVCYAELGDWDLAADALARSARLGPNYVDAFEALARVEVERQQPSAALAALAAGLEHNPENGALLRLRVQVLLDHDDLDAAAAALEQIPAGQRDVDDLCTMATLAMRAQRYDQALEHARAAVKHDPRSAAAQHTLGLALEGQQPLERAAVIAAYRAAIERGDPAGAAGTRLGFVLLEESAPEAWREAQAVLEAAAVRNGRDPGTLLNWALACAKTGQRARAAELCQAIAVAPTASASVREQAARLARQI